MPSDRPTRLVVVGAAAGIGRWLSDHVLATMAWDHVTLVDASEQVHTVEHRFAGPVTRTQRIVDVAFDGSATAVCLAVPIATLPAVTAELLPNLRSDAVVFHLANEQVRAGSFLRAQRADIALFGVHALFGLTAEQVAGQTFAVCPDADHPGCHRWLAEAIDGLGGLVNELTPEHHDEIMGVVQTAAHQSLLAFADVVGRSGFDLERDLWANRTPVFELLLGLASRVLAPGQEFTTASIQAADENGRIATSFSEAVARLGETRQPQAVAALREPFPGTLFSRIQQAGGLAIAATQATRARIAQHRHAGELVAAQANDGARLHVGIVERATPTSFTLRNVLVGQPGRAALLTDAEAIANAKKLGIAGTPRSVELTLGKVRLLTSSELETALDSWLATVTRGCKFLVPEGISGASARRVVEGVVHVTGVELVSEEVRLGQREVVVRFRARSDRDIDVIERAIQARIDEVFEWPDGVVLPVVVPVDRIGYLGPQGTFSEVAARQLARLLGAADTPRIEHADFPSLLAALEAGDVPIIVLPMTNSSSGLVDLAARTLAAANPDVVAGGVVDVPVRIDAYTATGTTFHPGADVYTHPQVLRQCSAFIGANHLVGHECTSTADACRLVIAQNAGVALAGAGMELELPLELHRASVANLAGALTRFLVLARTGTFGTPPRADVTTRSIWIIDGDLPPHRAARYDEVLRGPSGRSLVVSTRADRLMAGIGVRFVGTLPWSPRTPIVVVE